jgi:hypothetical protein
MKLSTLMLVNALVAAVFGVGFIVVPGQVMSAYGPEVTPQLEYVTRLFALFVGASTGFIVSLIGQLGGVMNALGWSTVVIYLLLALGFEYFYAQPKETQ